MFCPKTPPYTPPEKKLSFAYCQKNSNNFIYCQKNGNMVIKPFSLITKKMAIHSEIPDEIWV